MKRDKDFKNKSLIAPVPPIFLLYFSYWMLNIMDSKAWYFEPTLMILFVATLFTLVVSLTWFIESWDEIKKAWGL